MSVIERPESRKLRISQKSASADYSYGIIGPVSTDGALAQLVAAAPNFVMVGAFLCGSPEYSVDPVHNPEESGKSLYSGTVSYKTSDKSDNEEEEPKEPEDLTTFTFDFTTLEDVKLYSDDIESYDKDGKTTKKYTAINKHHPDLPPEGISYNVPIATFTAKTVIPNWQADQDWFKDRLDQVWTTNQAVFMSFPKQSVMFTGMNGTHRTDGHWDISYSFEYRPDKTGATFDAGGGNEIVVPDTNGWAQLSLEYSKHVKSDDDEKTKDQVWREIQRVHVIEVYETSDFDDLGMNLGEDGEVL